MKVLFIGGTGNISTEVSKLCVKNEIDLFLLNRGKRNVKIEGANEIIGDISDIESCTKVLENHNWDVVVNWIAFTKQDVENDIKLFSGKTKQYIFISSASAYQKPPSSPFITESTPLKNPFWQYSRNKIECEETLMNEYRNNDFPVTIVRPSLTYDTVIPVPIGGWTEYTIVDRIKKGMKIIVHGDGTSLWTIMHAKDFAKGFIGLLGHQQVIGESFHITSDEILTWNQIHEALAEAVGNKANIVHIPSEVLAEYDENLTGGLLGDKAHSVIFDNSKIKRYVPNFTATIPFKQGIKNTIDWFEADQKRQIIKEETNDWFDKVISDFEKH
ncbi:MAG: NAD-dependent epimerase/dehydratase family protein [Ignavibacteriales bacterium]|nr:NAD-dependent epimerase/dehydratase family protein [Ignavibacteriales bacterium]